MEPKSLFKSKTFWVNFLTILVALGAAFGIYPDAELGAQVSSALLVLSPLLNIVLRILTKQPVAL